MWSNHKYVGFDNRFGSKIPYWIKSAVLTCMLVRIWGVGSGYQFLAQPSGYIGFFRGKLNIWIVMGYVLDKRWQFLQQFLGRLHVVKKIAPHTRGKSIVDTFCSLAHVEFEAQQVWTWMCPCFYFVVVLSTISQLSITGVYPVSEFTDLPCLMQIVSNGNILICRQPFRSY